jgi:hypothetical protein
MFSGGELERVTTAIVSPDGRRFLFANGQQFGVHDLATRRTWHPRVDFAGRDSGPHWVDPKNPQLCCFTVDHWDKKRERNDKMSVALVDWRHGTLAQTIRLPDLRSDDAANTYQRWYGAPCLSADGRLYCGVEVTTYLAESLAKQTRMDVCVMDRGSGKLQQQFRVHESGKSRFTWGSDEGTPTQALSPDGNWLAVALPAGTLPCSTRIAARNWPPPLSRAASLPA